MPRPAPLPVAGLPALLAGVSVLLAGLAPAAFAQGTAPAAPGATVPRSAGPAAPDPAFEAARAAFEARPEAERRAVQDALVWVGGYTSVVTGAFGRRTYEAIGAWQAKGASKGGGGAATGILDEPARAALLAAGEAARRAARFTVAADPATGLVIGIPERLLAKRTRLPDGSRWQSPDGRVTLDTRAFAPGGPDLDALFAQSAAAGPERRVTYSLRRPDFTVVTGETPGGKFYIRDAAGPAGLRGFSLSYDKAMAREVDRLAIAIANSFVPFPGDRPAPAPAPRPAAASPESGPAAATGLAVGPRRIVAVLPGACPGPQAGGAPARILRRDAASGLALLEAAAIGPPPVLAPAPAPPGTAVVVLAAGADGPSVATGDLAAGGVLAPPQPGAAGAPVLARPGRLLGLVARLPATPRLVAGVLPPLTHPLVGLDALRSLLGADAPPAPAGDGPPLSAGAIAGRYAGAVVGVRCGE
ncbi:peptidoglycan-binding domain-containing protein [Methylobacterium platani]|uniref:Peptidoglycan-binding protein n=1 Tax=Methylobacterium platani JCM 14648 TaxID=1295136 RepID=A0ABR5H7S3_9HYPH|nr:peptidoglycan-binding domain-containing protein [Methylobacterium platani]KMO20475.1 peptidoglycan-binding protein [Methylobacterium platani JCM 14648]